MLVNRKHFRTVWMKDGKVMMINQLFLPHRFEIAELKDYRSTAMAIKDMVVRGAGAIGAAAGFAAAQAALSAPESDFEGYVTRAAKTIKSTRPTAQNLFYAVDRVLESMDFADTVGEKREAAAAEAQRIADEDAASCKRIGELGSTLVKRGARISTHCNAGWLAFVDWGSALSPVYKAAREGKDPFVWVDETRPRCQGTKLTAWELGEEGIAHAIIPDNATGHYMRKGEVDLVIVGSDRIAMNGDVANKIGTYTNAVLAKENGIPFYVAAPTSTMDPGCPSGDRIPIEERSQEEVLGAEGVDMRGFSRVTLAPKGSTARNPAFDVTPSELVTGIITEKGIFKPSDIRGIFKPSNSY